MIQTQLSEDGIKWAGWDGSGDRSTHCVTGSPGLCRASCSPARCGWARRSRGSPSSPRTGTPLTSALDGTNTTSEGSSSDKLCERSKKKKKKASKLNCKRHGLFVPSVWSEVELWHRNHHIASRGTELTGVRPGDRGCQLLWFPKQLKNRSRKWPTYPEMKLPLSSCATHDL